MTTTNRDTTLIEKIDLSYKDQKDYDEASEDVLLFCSENGVSKEVQKFLNDVANTLCTKASDERNKLYQLQAKLKLDDYANAKTEGYGKNFDFIAEELIDLIAAGLAAKGIKEKRSPKSSLNTSAWLVASFKNLTKDSDDS